MIGARVKLARSAAGLSLRALEDRLGGFVTAQAVGKYERDEMMPGSDVLIALARALEVSEDYLLRDDAVELVGVDFRKRRLDKAKDRARVESQVLGAVERYLEIEDLLTLETDWQPPSGFPKKVTTPDEAEGAAERLRLAWGLGVDPIPSLAEFLEEQAIKIVSVALPEGVSGVNARVRKANGHPVQVIVLNSEHAGERQRFTLSHELGHLVLEPRSSAAEEICNRFAGAFLIPAAALRRELGDHRTSVSFRELFYLKALFGVSAQAIAFRSADLGIINARLKKELFIQFGKRGFRKEEPNPVTRECPARFRRLCLRALSEDVVSASKVAELLGVSTRALLASLDHAPPPLTDASPPGV